MTAKLTLTLEVGKKYVNRDGFVRTVLMTDRKTDDGRTVLTIGHAKHYTINEAARFHLPNGEHGQGPAYAGDDLVSDYVEPIADRYVVVKANGTILTACHDATYSSLALDYPVALANGGRIIKIREVRD